MISTLYAVSNFRLFNLQLLKIKGPKKVFKSLIQIFHEKHKKVFVLWSGRISAACVSAKLGYFPFYCLPWLHIIFKRKQTFYFVLSFSKWLTLNCEKKYISFTETLFTFFIRSQLLPRSIIKFSAFNIFG